MGLSLRSAVHPANDSQGSGGAPAQPCVVFNTLADLAGKRRDSGAQPSPPGLRLSGIRGPTNELVGYCRASLTGLDIDGRAMFEAYPGYVAARPTAGLEGGTPSA